MNRPTPTERMAAQLIPSTEELEQATPSRVAALTRILAEPPPQRRPVRARRTVPTLRWPAILSAAAAVAVVLLVAAIAGFVSSRAIPVATPALPTSDADAIATTDPAVLLSQLADRAASQPPMPGTGRFDYVQTRGWYLDTETRSTGVTGKIDLTEREQWIAADGAGRIEETRSGIRTATSQLYPAGGLFRPAPLPTDPAGLERVLAQDHPNHGTAEWFTAAGDVWDPQVVEPPLQAALLRMLATKPDMTVLGAVTDRVGRPGVAINTRSSYSGVPTDYTLIFSPATGALLDFEQVALQAGDFPIHAPATISYTAWLKSGRVDSTNARP